MSNKFSDFLSSFGLMILGVFLLLVGSVTFSHATPARPLAAVAGIKMVASGTVPTIRLSESSGGDNVLPPSLPLHPEIPLATTNTPFEGGLSAAAAIVVDDKTNAPLFELNSAVPRPLASITKLMTALVLQGLPINWASTTVVEQDDIDPGSHSVSAGERFTLEDLWHVALVGSSNSAINALVRASGLSEEAFVTKMNSQVEEWRLRTLHFVEPTGLSPQNVGSASDVVRLLQRALQNDKIYSALQIGEYYAHPIGSKQARRVWSTDWLLNNWVPNNFDKENIVGKTGYIAESGYNFAVRLADDNHRAVRVVVLGTDSNTARFSEARDLAEWVLTHYRWPSDHGYLNLANDVE
ncbi:MAG: D-alanyl-D-alanine carboxypeptidase [Candidatus Magasanikbacteria bacterium]|nr:D-alanyl-D-alanine carboxypeptidase [Candidatus Magasanikbacteria bacterium]